MGSPYAGRPIEEWLTITEQLIAKHPLNLDTWKYFLQKE